MVNSVQSYYQNIIKSLLQLLLHLGKRRRLQLSMLLMLMVFTSFAEIFSIGMLAPFIGVISSPEHLSGSKLLKPLINLLKLSSPQELILPLTVIFCVSAVIAGVMRLTLLWVLTRISFGIGADLSVKAYRCILYQSYEIHIGRNSSEVIDSLTNKIDSIIYSTLLPSLTIISSIIISVAIMVVLIAMNPWVAFVSFSTFGFLYALIIRFTHKQLLLDGNLISKESNGVIKNLQEGLGGIRDILIDGSQEVYIDEYRKIDERLRRSQGNGIFISQSPRFVVEALGMVLIAVLTYSLTRDSANLYQVIPMVAVLALGAQRLLPVLQQIYSSWAFLQAGTPALLEILHILKGLNNQFTHNSKSDEVIFEKEILLNGVSFKYAKSENWVLKNIDIKITKGSKVGIIGETGSGKSTLLDILLGLIKPTTGTIKIDGVELGPRNLQGWGSRIAHVPQDIYLADATVEKNIAFGVLDSAIDHERVRWAARQAQIADVIDGWPKQYCTKVGERGVRMSGGQRQRIGVARAIYKNADVIFLDEATSALDNETEGELMKVIENFDKSLTVFIVAHRVSTLRKCDFIITLDKGGIKKIQTFHEVLKNHY